MNATRHKYIFIKQAEWIFTPFVFCATNAPLRLIYSLYQMLWGVFCFSFAYVPKTAHSVLYNMLEMKKYGGKRYGILQN